MHLPEEAQQQAGRLPVAALVVLAAAIFAAITTEMLPVGLMPQLAEAFAVDEQHIGWWMSTYAGVVALTAIPAAQLLKRIPRRRALIGLLALYAVSNAGILLAGATGTFAVALAARMVGGLAHAGLFTVVISTAIAISPPGRQGRAVAGVNLGLTVALTMGVPIGTAVGSAWAWQWAFVATTVILVALAVTARRILPAGRRPDRTSAAQRTSSAVVSGELTRGPLLRAAVVTAVFSLGHYATYTYVAPLILDSGAGTGGVSAALFGHGLACLPGVLLAGALADKHPLAGLRAAFALSAACLLVLALFPHTAGAVLAATTIWGAAFGAAPALLQMIAVRTTGDPDVAPAVVNAMFNVGIAAGAWMGGAILAQATGALAATSAAIVGAALLLTFLLKPPGSSRVQKPPYAERDTRRTEPLHDRRDRWHRPCR